MGKAKIEFLQGTKVVSTMDVEIKAGLNRYQWNMRGPAPAGAANFRGFGGGGGGGGGRDLVPTDPNAPPPTPEMLAAEAAQVPFAGGGGFGGGGGGGGGRRGALGPVLAPGTYMIRIVVGDKTLTSSVDVLEDVWMNQR